MFKHTEMHMLKKCVVNVCHPFDKSKTDTFIFFDASAQPHVFWPRESNGVMKLDAGNVFPPRHSYNWIQESFVFNVVQCDVNSVDDIDFGMCLEIAKTARS